MFSFVRSGQMIAVVGRKIGAHGFFTVSAMRAGDDVVFTAVNVTRPIESYSHFMPFSELLKAATLCGAQPRTSCVALCKLADIVDGALIFDGAFHSLCKFSIANMARAARIACINRSGAPG